MNKFILKIKYIRDSRWFSNLTTSIIIFYASVLGFETLDTVAQPLGDFLHVLDYETTAQYKHP